MSRLVVVSNRVWPNRQEALAGGVAVAITDVLQRRGGLWSGWSGKLCERLQSDARIEGADELTLAVIDLTRLDFEGYYNGHANRCLWPLCHFRLDLMKFNAANEAAYRRVNAQIAIALQPLLRKDDLIWVHDYHLIPLGGILRSMGCHQRIGFFLHVPFPPPELLLCLPSHQRLVNDLLCYDLIGMQTDSDLQRLSDYLEREAGGSVCAGIASALGCNARVGCFPVGIDAERFVRASVSAIAEKEAQHMKNALRGRDQIISVDRLDYSKGLLRRLAAVEELLACRPDLHGHIEFLQIAPTSRTDLRDYQDFRRELEAAAARVNGRFSQADWTPIQYVNHTLSRTRLCGLYRASRIGLVTPMRDGMNLVCKEYVAAQDKLDPGVLVLSCFAGAARRMPASILVNPYDVIGVAAGITQARNMPLEERRNRHAELMEGIRHNDSTRWAESFLDALAA